MTAATSTRKSHGRTGRRRSHRRGPGRRRVDPGPHPGGGRPAGLEVRVRRGLDHPAGPLRVGGGRPDSSCQPGPPRTTSSRATPTIMCSFLFGVLTTLCVHWPRSPPGPTEPGARRGLVRPPYDRPVPLNAFPAGRVGPKASGSLTIMSAWGVGAPGVLSLPSSRLVRGRGLRRPLLDAALPQFGCTCSTGNRSRCRGKPAGFAARPRAARGPPRR